MARLRGELNEARDRQRAAETERNSVRSLMESESRRFLTRQATLQKNAADMAAEIRAKEAALEQAHGELSALQGREASGGGPASLEEQERALRAKAEEVAERERELRAQMQAALKDFDALAKKKDAYKSETLRLRERRKEMMAQLKTVIQDRDNLAKMVEELTGKPPKTSSVQLKVCACEGVSLGQEPESVYAECWTGLVLSAAVHAVSALPEPDHEHHERRADRGRRRQWVRPAQPSGHVASGGQQPPGERRTGGGGAGLGCALSGLCKRRPIVEGQKSLVGRWWTAMVVVSTKPPRLLM